MIYVYPYKVESTSARALKRGLSSSLQQRILFPTPTFSPARLDILINWGNSKPHNFNWTLDWDLNAPEAVSKASNKLKTLQNLQESSISIPPFTTNKEEAESWSNEGMLIVARTILNGHSGQGIQLIEPNAPMPDASLYVQYIKKRYEYRVHIFKGVVIDTQQKKKNTDANRAGTINTFIRSHSNGWIFSRSSIDPDIHRDSIAIETIRTLGLDFGAVDIIYNERQKKYYTLEVNTAPGLEGTTLENYITTITNYIREKQNQMPSL